VSRLDPRDPLVLDTQPVARRPGTMVEVERTAPAPSGLGTDVVGVPSGAPVELYLRLESVVEGVLVSGMCRTQASGECVRCLDPVTIDLELDFQPVLRDAVVLALPLQPVCRDDCLGLCASCGARLNDEPEHQHEEVDPRWAALGALHEQGSNATDAPSAS
jgi:uncharacterized protein